ncbi:MAG: paraslipin [Synergistales bacterium]|nr:paraslipin [Synergistales bacterium]
MQISFGLMYLMGIVVGIIVVITLVFKSGVIVPQQNAYVIERLGKYKKTLSSGLHLVMPFFDRVAYRHSLKEQAKDVPPQMCITQDNVSIDVDGVLYYKVVDPVKASYGVSDYEFASIQLSQTTMRSIIGTMKLDKTFEERERINEKIIRAVDEASDPWGVQVTRYEVRNISPPESIRQAMESEMKAEREKRATIATSEGKKQAQINSAQADREEMIQRSEGEKQKRLNEAEGEAGEIERLADATARGLAKVAEAISRPQGSEAVNLRIAEQYVKQFGHLARENNTMIVPQNLSDIAGTVASLSRVLEQTGHMAVPAGETADSPRKGE